MEIEPGESSIDYMDEEVVAGGYVLINACIALTRNERYMILDGEVEKFVQNLYNDADFNQELVNDTLSLIGIAHGMRSQSSKQDLPVTPAALDAAANILGHLTAMNQAGQTEVTPTLTVGFLGHVMQGLNIDGKHYMQQAFENLGAALQSREAA